MGGKRPFFARLSVQFVTALIAVTVIPGVLRYVTFDELRFTTSNALIFNGLAVLIATWARVSIGTFPGVGRARYVLSTVTSAHAVSFFVVLMARIPYDRVTLLLGLVLHLAVDLWLNTRRTQQQLRYATVPFGEACDIGELQAVTTEPIVSPTDPLPDDISGIAVDFAADLPDEWQRYIADQALAGRTVLSARNLKEIHSGRVELERISENDFGTLVPTRGWFEFKGLIDRLGAAILIPILALPMLAIALAIRIGDGGRALYRQQRTGLGGRQFTMLKFRTMSERDDRGDGVRDAQTVDGDDRITKLGKLLRKMRLDELPQLINVLKGEMSFIGPRPEAQVLSSWYEEAIPFYRYRHVVRPGITGWAAVNQGHVIGVEDSMIKLQFDFYYIKYFSPWIDVLIAMKTLRTMVTGSGAK